MQRIDVRDDLAYLLQKRELIAGVRRDGFRRGFDV